MISSRWSVVIALAFAARASVATLAGAPPAQQEQERKASLAALTKSAASYQVKLNGKRTAKLSDEPLFRWSKPISEIQDAVLYAWTVDGRPVAAGSFLRTRLGDCHEFQSLALEPLRADRGDKTAWEPGQPGIQFDPVPGSLAAADTTNKRLVQMTSLVEQFRIEAMKGPPFYSIPRTRFRRCACFLSRCCGMPTRNDQISRGRSSYLPTTPIPKHCCSLRTGSAAGKRVGNLPWPR